jgi:hypothetical protein
MLSGCISPKYRMAANSTPAPAPLQLAAVQGPLELALNTVIIFKGAGSWKREALWDEYVVTLHNRGEQALTISDPVLIDNAGTPHAPGADPWALEKESLRLEKSYRRTGVAFARNTVPGVLILGTGAAAVGSAGVFSAGAATAATATVVALPVYYLVVVGVNHTNKKSVATEFKRRRLVLPLTLEPGETRTGSWFLPMVPSPQSLNLHWSNSSASGAAVLSLESLHGIHAKSPAPAVH